MEIHVFARYLFLGMGLFHLLICDRFKVRNTISLLYVMLLLPNISEFLPFYKVTYVEMVMYGILGLIFVYSICYLLRFFRERFYKKSSPLA